MPVNLGMAHKFNSFYVSEEMIFQRKTTNGAEIQSRNTGIYSGYKWIEEQQGVKK